jgi:hypothetical protein
MLSSDATARLKACKEKEEFC